MKRILLSATAALMTATTASHAMGQCGDREAITQHLAEKFGERHAAIGLQSDSGLLEIWSSEQSGTWSVLLTRPDGQTCVMATGTDFYLLPELLKPAGLPA